MKKKYVHNVIDHFDEKMVVVKKSEFDKVLKSFENSLEIVRKKDMAENRARIFSRDVIQSFWDDASAEIHNGNLLIVGSTEHHPQLVKRVKLIDVLKHGSSGKARSIFLDEENTDGLHLTSQLKDMKGTEKELIACLEFVRNRIMRVEKNEARRKRGKSNVI